MSRSDHTTPLGVECNSPQELQRQAHLKRTLFNVEIGKEHVEATQEQPDQSLERISRPDLLKITRHNYKTFVAIKPINVKIPSYFTKLEPGSAGKLAEGFLQKPGLHLWQRSRINLVEIKLAEIRLAGMKCQSSRDQKII